MACFTPVQGFEKVGLTKNGKFGFTLNPRSARRVNGIAVPRIVPCRKCDGCRADHARQNFTKIMHEASLYFNGYEFENSFITLTYNDDNIPLYGSLDYDRDWTNFIKRLRLELAPKQIRYFMIGEYGDLNLRPHYHAIIFGHSFPDKVYHEVRFGNIIYRSPLLEKVWTVSQKDNSGRKKGSSMGYSSVGDVSVASAGYVARYCMKKVIGFDPDSLQHNIDYETGEVKIGRYRRLHPETGEIIEVSPEQNRSSNGGGKSGKGGIGKIWFDLYGKSDYYCETDLGTYKDHTHLPNGLIVKPPKYFDKLLERTDSQLFENIKKSRQDFVSAHADEFTPERLESKRLYFLEKTKNLKRGIRSVYG